MSESTGITERHARSCHGRSGGRCSCKPTYQAHVWDANAGKRIRKTFPTRSAAKRWRQDAYPALRAGELSADRGPILKEAAMAWIDGLRNGTITNRSGDAYKPRVVRDYDRIFRARILPALGHLCVGEVTTKDVQRLVDDLVGKGAAPATIDTAITPLKAERMIAALNGADRVLWATAFYTGMRRGELTALRREDVDLATGVVHVRRSWDEREGEIAPKSRKGYRKVPVAAVLRDHLDQPLLDSAAERVFESQWWIAKAAERAHEVWNAAGLPLVTLHDCRHTFASFAIAAGMNAKTLSTIMGHADIATTYDLYGHLLPGSEDEAAARLDAFFAATVAQTVAHPEKVAA